MSSIKRFELRAIATMSVFAVIIFGSAIYADAQETKDAPRSGLAVPGMGLEGIMIGVSTLDDVAREYGDGFEEISHKKYSIEYDYKNLGLSFYACAMDPHRRIFVIEILAPYQATTPEGAVLGRPMNDELRQAYKDIGGIAFEYGDRNVLTTIDIFDKEGLTQCDSVYGKSPEANEQ